MSDDVLRKFIKENLLQELRVVDLGSRGRDSYGVLVYKDYLFILNNQFYVQDDIEELAIEVSNYVDLSSVVKDVENEEYHTDWFNGNVADGILLIGGQGNFKQDPKTSYFIKKIVKQLGLSGVRVEKEDAGMNGEYDAESEKFQKHEMLGKLPDVLYHGTSSGNIIGIAKAGLRPGGSIGKSNWGDQGVWHDKTVSLVATPHKCAFHAYNAVDSVDGFPIIVGATLPDRDKIVADFDIDEFTGRTQFNGKHNNKEIDKERNGRGPEKTSVDVGVVGYVGRIPASFIGIIYYYSKLSEDWIESNLENVMKMQEIYEISPSAYEEDYNKFFGDSEE